ncbi:hypothetical protein [Paraburkholderia sp. MM5477-R1]|uniref:hypothetical protein n=1 Tax=Paraburkholderia sp. MM5477-R1 TaxID=2991062 RepID=UPI003D1AE9AF
MSDFDVEFLESISHCSLTWMLVAGPYVPERKSIARAWSCQIFYDTDDMPNLGQQVIQPVEKRKFIVKFENQTLETFFRTSFRAIISFRNSRTPLNFNDVNYLFGANNARYKYAARKAVFDIEEKPVALLRCNVLVVFVKRCKRDELWWLAASETILVRVPFNAANLIGM